MRWLAHVHAQHGDLLPATLRERYGVSLWDVGGAVSWQEGLALTRAALRDTSTALGAAEADWSYPATQVELLQMAGTFGKAARRIFPFDIDQAEAPSSEEVADAQAELEAGIRFSN